MAELWTEATALDRTIGEIARSMEGPDLMIAGWWYHVYQCVSMLTVATIGFHSLLAPSETFAGDNWVMVVTSDSGGRALEAHVQAQAAKQIDEEVSSGSKEIRHVAQAGRPEGCIGTLYQLFQNLVRRCFTKELRRQQLAAAGQPRHLAKPSCLQRGVAFFAASRGR